MEPVATNLVTVLLTNFVPVFQTNLVAVPVTNLVARPEAEATIQAAGSVAASLHSPWAACITATVRLATAR